MEVEALEGEARREQERECIVHLESAQQGREGGVCKGGKFKISIGTSYEKGERKESEEHIRGR